MPRSVNVIRAGFGFLTTIPLGFNQEDLESLARSMWVYVLVGAAIGLLVGVISYALSLTPNINDMVRAGLTLIALYAITGFIHLDGLADVGDGLLKHGTVQERLRVIKDPNIGVGGIAFCIIAFLLLFSVLTSIKSAALIAALIAAEAAAKLSMVGVASFGKATHKGLGSLFSEKSGPLTFVAGLVLAVAIVVLCLGIKGILVLLPPIAVSFGLVKLANTAFGGINGDVIGSSNELGRLTALIVISLL
ncbi:MAG TPA: adenosylcobinamide-GDP ribazoletransferase [Candidatus Acidoferrales bacterium]|nr:adenosylcobinamide-GDP ribazoletransferase [Candidatus Acidoferrales bacterium]